MVERVLISVQKLVGLSNDPINTEYKQDNVDEKENVFSMANAPLDGKGMVMYEF